MIDEKIIYVWLSKLNISNTLKQKAITNLRWNTSFF